VEGGARIGNWPYLLLPNWIFNGPDTSAKIITKGAANDQHSL